MEWDQEYLAAINREQVRRYTEARLAYRGPTESAADRRLREEKAMITAALQAIVAERTQRDRRAKFRDEACQWLARIEGARAKHGAQTPTRRVGAP